MDIARLARAQRGVVSRRQVLGQVNEPLSEHALQWRLDAGRWRRVVPGVWSGARRRGMGSLQE